MKCDDYQEIIEEYIDGELDRASAERVRIHLAACENCLAFSEEVRREQEIYTHYERDIEISPALWATIEDRITTEQVARPPAFTSRLRQWFMNLASTPRFSPALAVALVIITVGVTVALMSYLHSTGPGAGNQEIANNNASDNEREKLAGNLNANESTQPGVKDETQSDLGERVATKNPKEEIVKPNAPEERQVASNTPRPRKPRPVVKEPTPEELIREAEQKYVAAINILSRDVNSRRSQIDPKVLARFDTALADIDYTIAETRTTVRQHPNDPVALQYMLSAYAKKVDVLREMAREQ